MDREKWLIIIVCFLTGFLASWLFGGKRKGSEGKYLPNLVIVANTDIERCSPSLEMCYHIHHWMFLAVLLVGYFSLNYVMGYSASVNYLYLVALYLGVSFSEYVFYGNDIFDVYRKCYPNCKFF